MRTYLNDAITACNHALWNEVDVAHACQTLGNVLQSLGRFEEAMDWHTRSIQSHPNRADLFASLGKLYAQQRCWTEAIAAYQQTLKLQPNHAGAYWSLANIYAQLGQPGEELACRQRALKLKPDWTTPQTHLTFGNWLMTQNQADDAIACYRCALQLQPNFLEAQYNLAVALAKQEAWEEAIAAYRQALALNPAHSESYFGLGKALKHQQNWQEAIACYRKAVEFQPNSVSALHALGELLLQQEQWEEGIAIYRRAIELNPGFSWSHHYIGYALLKRRQYQDAIIALRCAIHLNASFPWTYYHLAAALFQQQQWEEVIITALSAIQLQPDLAEIYSLLGQAIRRRSGSRGLDDLVAAYRQAPPVQPDNQNAQFYQQIAYRLLQSRHCDGAILFYQLAIGQKPDDASLMASLKQAIAAKQTLEQTIATHRQRIARQPQLPWFYSQLANVLADQGELEEAISLNQKANLLHGWQQVAHKSYEFTRDWFSHHIPTWHKHLNRQYHMPGLNALEIGSFEGRSACWLLDQVLTHPTSRITCIDLYFQDRFNINIDRSGARAKVTKLQGNSLDLLPTLPLDSYDLIYIDGCHLAEHVQCEARLSWGLLKSGGIMIFDDYEFQDPNHPGQDPKSAIDKFLASVRTEVEVLHRAYQVILQKQTNPHKSA